MSNLPLSTTIWTTYSVYFSRHRPQAHGMNMKYEACLEFYMTICLPGSTRRLLIQQHERYRSPLPVWVVVAEQAASVGAMGAHQTQQVGTIEFAIFSENKLWLEEL